MRWEANNSNEKRDYAATGKFTHREVDKTSDHLSEPEEIILPATANIIKETKIGYGIEFLPSTTANLSKKSPLLITELTESGLCCERKWLML